MAGRSLKYTPMQVKNKIEELPDPAYTARTLADKIGCSHKTILNRLNELEADGEVDGKSVGANAKVWWIRD